MAKVALIAGNTGQDGPNLAGMPTSQWAMAP
jgi:hypothetical protein